TSALTTTVLPAGMLVPETGLTLAMTGGTGSRWAETAVFRTVLYWWGSLLSQAGASVTTPPPPAAPQGVTSENGRGRPGRPATSVQEKDPQTTPLSCTLIELRPRSSVAVAVPVSVAPKGSDVAEVIWIETVGGASTTTGTEMRAVAPLLPEKSMGVAAMTRGVVVSPMASVNLAVRSEGSG